MFGNWSTLNDISVHKPTTTNLDFSAVSSTIRKFCLLMFTNFFMVIFLTINYNDNLPGRDMSKQATSCSNAVVLQEI